MAVLPSKRIPGMLITDFSDILSEPLFLKFQLNPFEIETTKDVKWDVDDIPGIDAPLLTWVGGGLKTIKFELIFDSTHASDPLDGAVRKALKGTGVWDRIAVLEKFMYPMKAGNFSFIRLIGSGEEFRSPPKAVLVYGLKVVKGIVRPGTFLESLYNRALVPQRVTVPIEFLVLEEGLLNEANTSVRNILALVSTALDVADLGFYLEEWITE